ncbi:MAG: hypothetical protein R2865_12565 [Deinococcales bacterium]
MQGFKKSHFRKHSRKHRHLYLIMSTVLVMSACSLPSDATIDGWVNRTVTVLEQATRSIDQASQDWQTALQEAQSKLTEDLQSTIRTEVNDLVQRGIAATGVELRCNADFLGIRMRQAVQRIIDRLLGRTPQAFEPYVCQPIPTAIDLGLDISRRNKIEFYGFDFDIFSGQFKVFLEDSAGNRQDVNRT